MDPLHASLHPSLQWTAPGCSFRTGTLPSQPHMFIYTGETKTCFWRVVFLLQRTWTFFHLLSSKRKQLSVSEEVLTGTSLDSTSCTSHSIIHAVVCKGASTFFDRLRGPMPTICSLAFPLLKSTMSPLSPATQLLSVLHTPEKQGVHQTRLSECLSPGPYQRRGWVEGCIQHPLTMNTRSCRLG